MSETTYNPAWEGTPAGALSTDVLLEVALHRATMTADVVERTRALTALHDQLSAPGGVLARLRQARVGALAQRAAAGETHAAIAADLGLTTSRVGQLLTGNVTQTAARRARTGRRPTVRDEVGQARAALHDQVKAARAADRAARGAAFAARLDAEDITHTALAKEAGISRQELVALVAAARKAREVGVRA